jgi:hypothetical protein
LSTTTVLIAYQGTMGYKTGSVLVAEVIGCVPAAALCLLVSLA